VLPVLLLQAVMAERDDAIEKARSSDERYRAFVANSSEAIFRTELAEPMPITLSQDEQVAWVRRHAYVAECNAAFMVALGVKDAGSHMVGTRLADHPTWSRVYIDRIREAIRNNYQVRNVEHVVHGPYGLDRVLLISMMGIVDNGHVLRFWGTGRDVTAMREAENALAQHDAQLRALATEITLAEERARRKLASELHDGPAQNLTGMSLSLAAMKRNLADKEQVERIVELEQVLADTTLQTRTLMLELAPPGLHENGLVEALRWLAERVRQQQRLLVSVEDDGSPKPLEDPVAVLLFQTVRELLQNVVKHARSKRATGAPLHQPRTTDARRARSGRGFRGPVAQPAADSQRRLRPVQHPRASQAHGWQYRHPLGGGRRHDGAHSRAAEIATWIVRRGPESVRQGPEGNRRRREGTACWSKESGPPTISGTSTTSSRARKPVKRWWSIPLDARQCLDTARKHGFTITQVLNTHEHLDHTAGNGEVVAATRAKVLAHAGAANRIRWCGSRVGARRCDQGGAHRRARSSRHSRPHAFPCLPAGARRCPGAVLRRHVVQCRRGQLPQRRRCRPALRDLRQPARAAAGPHARLPGARIHGAQPGVHAGS
jgi:signal transduction histidine kinase